MVISLPAAHHINDGHKTDICTMHKRLLKKTSYAGCSKTPGYKARAIIRNEAYFFVRRNDE
jgi:hypothetical protein